MDQFFGTVVGGEVSWEGFVDVFEEQGPAEAHCGEVGVRAERSYGTDFVHVGWFVAPPHAAGGAVEICEGCSGVLEDEVEEEA